MDDIFDGLLDKKEASPGIDRKAVLNKENIGHTANTRGKSMGSASKRKTLNV